MSATAFDVATAQTPQQQPGVRVSQGMRHAERPVDSSHGIPTDGEGIRQAIAAAFGELDLARQIGDMVDQKLKTLGLDRVDRRYLAHPETISDHGENGRTALAEQIFARTGVVASPLHRAMDEWFRFVLFGRMPTIPEVTRALSEGTDSEGGYVVPPGFIAEIVADAPKISALYQWARRIPVRTMAGEIPTVATNASVSWGSENTAMGEGDPAFGQGTWTINRMNALVKQSRELANDSNPNIVEFVTGLFREKIVEERDRVVAVGTGSGQPMGLYSATGITDLDTITSLDYSALVDIHEGVDQRYFSAPNCRWQFNQNVKAEIMKIYDSQGQPLIQLDPTMGFRPMLFGHSISIENSLPDNYVGFGDLRFYLVFDRETLGVERSTEAGTAFATHQLWIKFWERWDGKPILPPTVPLVRARNVVLSN